MKRLFVLLLVLAPLCLRAGGAVACSGDCDGSGTVTAEDVRLAVEVALGRQGVDACLNADAGADGAIAIDDLAKSVNALLEACPVSTVTPTHVNTPRQTATPSPSPPPSATPIFPADYRSTFVEVRNCRFSIEHGGISVRVLTNPIAAQPYREEQNPLPVGSIVIKEEYEAADCSDDADLTRWRVMRKEEPGFDPADNDWHWQWVDRGAGESRSVRFDDKNTCVGCHVRPACKVRDYMCTEEGDAGTLREVLASQPAALLSVSGTGPGDIYAVGVDPPGDELGPYVLHYDGTSWRRLSTHASGNLWWVSVEPIGGFFYMSGEGGLILKLDPATKTFTRLQTATTALLYGIWGASGNDLWAVGGDAEDNGVVLRYDGASWTEQDLSGVIAGGLPTLFKVWGRSASEVYAVGQRGTILRYDGESWSQVPIDGSFSRPLFTVHGDANRVFAVGGFIDGAIVELDGASFQERTPAGLPQLNGVFVAANGRPAAVGLGLALARRSASGWALEQRQEGSTLDFHATWIDPEGGVWAVGGDLLDQELNKGVLYYAGARTISSVIESPPRCPTGDTGGGKVSYATEVAPLLQQAGCLSLGCHGGAFPSSGYDLRTYESTFKQGTEARFVLDVCPVVPGDASTSFLIEKLSPSPRVGVRMPQNLPPLSDPQIELIRTWIMEGARNN